MSTRSTGPGAFRVKPSASRIRVYLLGAFVEELDSADRTEVGVWLTNDDLELDISQSSVVRGKRLDQGLRLLAEAANEAARG